MSVLMIASCGGDESKAQRLYDEARAEVSAGNIELAIEHYQTLIDTYSYTESAARARKEILLYTGLTHAVKSYPERQVRELMVKTGRALELYRGRRGKWPTALDRLIPRYLDQPPIDPWGRVILYEPAGRRYKLTCFGEDGLPGGENAAADWTIVNGRFVSQPRGIE